MNTEHPHQPTNELLTLIAEAYQVIGILADECGRFDDPQVIKMLDNLAAERLVHNDVLPFSGTPELAPAPKPSHA